MYRKVLRDNINIKKNKGLYRYYFENSRPVGCFPKASYDTYGEAIVWCSNDYLNMSHNNKVIDASINGCKKYGVGSGGTRNISGNTSSVMNVERAISKFHGKSDALIFNSGYSANSGSLCSLGKAFNDSIFFSDKDNHASLIDGIRRSGREKKIFNHNDICHLESLLKEQPLERKKIIVFESIYSMDGSTAPIPRIVDLAKRYNAFTYVDEIHAVGLYGKGGRGLCNMYNCEKDVDVIQAGFGKAFGTSGGYIVSDKEVIDSIRLCAEPFIFTTSTSPVIAEATLESIKQIESFDEQRRKMKFNVRYMKSALIKNGFTVMNDEETHIIPVFVGDPFLCRQISNDLLNNFKHYVQPINFPTVPKWSERLRITPTYKHSRTMIDKLVLEMIQVFKNNNVKLN